MGQTFLPPFPLGCRSGCANSPYTSDGKSLFLGLLPLPLCHSSVGVLAVSSACGWKLRSQRFFIFTTVFLVSRIMPTT